MKLVFVLLTTGLYFVHRGESKKFRVSIDDQILPYEIDKRIRPLTDLFAIDDLIFEQIDDDVVIVGGHITCIKTMDPNLPLVMSLKTLYFERATWRDGPIRLGVGDTCKEIMNPARFWYNYTKLFSPCPPKIGDVWPIEQQSINVNIDLPPSTASGTWKVFGLFSQGMIGMEKIKFGFGFKYEFLT